MQIEVLGSGGAIATPRPGCGCRVCTQARGREVPYSRAGPSYFVHGPDLLIDTPEDARCQLNRAGLVHVPSCIYSHWHPDHTLGSRVFEMNLDFVSWPRVTRPTDIYLPQQVAADMRVRLGLWAQLSYMQKQGMVRLHELRDGDTLTLNGWSIRPFRLQEDFVYTFLFEGERRRVLIAPDELFGWQPPPELCASVGPGTPPGLDLAILPMGLAEFDPLRGERLIPADHPILRSEATFAQTLDVIRQLGADRVVLSHIEEPSGLTHDDYLELSARLQTEGLPIIFAYDTMRIDV